MLKIQLIIFTNMNELRLNLVLYIWKVEENIIGIDREIMDGNIKQRPYLGKNKQSACVYCDFRDICMFDMDGALSRMPDKDGARFGAEGKEDK